MPLSTNPSFGKIISHPATIPGIALVLVVLIWSVLLIEQQRNRDFIAQKAVDEAANLALAFEENVASTFQDADTALKLLRPEWQRGPQHFDERVRALQNAFYNDLLVQIAVIGADGFLRYSSLGPPKEAIDLSDREHFKVHRASTLDTLHISKPVLGRVSGRHTIQVTRAIRDGKTLMGVLVISLDPDYFTRFFGGVQLGERGAIMLVGTDGVLRARGSGQAAATNLIGVALPSSLPFVQDGSPPSGSVQALSPIDGRPKIYVYRRLAELSQSVVVALDVEDVFAEHHQRWERYKVWSAGVSLLMMFGAALLARSISLQFTFRNRLLALIQGLRTLNDIAVKPATLNERIDAALQLSRDYLTADYALYASLEPDGWTVTHYCASPALDDGLDRGQLTELFAAALREVHHKEAPRALRSFEAISHLYIHGADHAVSAVPVVIGGSRHGAVGFVFTPARDEPRGRDGELIRLVARLVGSMISEDLARRELERLATSDFLTGAKSRGFFTEAVGIEISNAARHGQPLSLALIDLDYFKSVNDRFGHPVGDETLRMVARTCQRALRAGDVLARLGGEEFAVLMPRATEADAMEIAERLKCSIAQGTVSSGELNVSITASLGVAQLAAGEDFAAFYNKADKALYAAKQRGRDCVVAASDVLAG
ncbi:sensor domain-containing diguanylate cyclase [Stutzerimonas stutzeri]|uniref:sensor domain-containing diguanylate cyclase n=1 Tax=Stutzerimonas stutzeri TaxID=316 RepID=UPI001C2E2DDA|nr:diguanylate cyclase [Stutzerimonas stutzeri]